MRERFPSAGLIAVGILALLPLLSRPLQGAPQSAPALSADASETVPVDYTRVYRVRGSGGALSVETDRQAVARARVVENGAAIEVRGVAPGKCTVTVRRGAQTTHFAVTVKKYAGSLDPVGVVEVTGAPAPGFLVRRAAEQRLLQAVRTEPGAWAKVTGEPEGGRALGPGDSAVLTVPLTINGPGYLAREVKAQVRVNNLALPAEEPKTLLYSNNPESIYSGGTLYQGAVEPDASSRLLYHHQNKMGASLLFQIHLVNPHDAPADVHVLTADAGPGAELQSGHQAVYRYLDQTGKNLGYVARVPARGTATLLAVTVPAGLTVSGIHSLRVLKGDAVVAHVSAHPRAVRPAATAELLAQARAQAHVYPPQKEAHYEYVVGEKWVFAPLGRHALASRLTEQKLLGNYGVLYRITVDVRNPTNEERIIRVALNPEAGWARGAFFIDGELVEAPQVAPPTEGVLSTFKLGPGESRRLSIRSIPAGGGFYPVSVVVRS